MKHIDDKSGGYGQTKINCNKRIRYEVGVVYKFLSDDVKMMSIDENQCVKFASADEK